MWLVVVYIYVALLCLDFIHRACNEYKARSRNCAKWSKIPWYDFLLPFGTYVSFQIVSEFLWGDPIDFARKYFIKADRLTVPNWFCGSLGIMTSNPDVMKATLSTSFKDFGTGKRHLMLAPLSGSSVFTLSGEPWKHSRSQLRPQFARDQISRLDSVKSHADTFIDIMLDKSTTGRPDCQTAFHSLTFDTITDFLCGESANTLLQDLPFKRSSEACSVTSSDFVTAFDSAARYLGLRVIVGGQFYRFIDSPKFRRDIATCKKYIGYFVERALEKPLEKGEVAEKFNLLRELTKETRDPEVIRDQAFSIMMAGRDTTAGTLSFMTCYLSKNPKIWARLKEEVLEHFGTDSSSITFESLKQCKYLRNVINETLRLSPIVPYNFRMATKDTVIPTGGGPNEDEPIFVAKGGIVLMSVYSMHRSEKLWGANSLQFDPDRWEDGIGNSSKFLPFGGGPRVCIGQQFAHTEIACIFVRICQRVDHIEIFKEGDPALFKQRLGVSASVSGGIPSKWT